MQRALRLGQVHVPQLQRCAAAPQTAAVLLTHFAKLYAVNTKQLLFYILPGVGAGVLLILGVWIYCCCCRKRGKTSLKCAVFRVALGRVMSFIHLTARGRGRVYQYKEDKKAAANRRLRQERHAVRQDERSERNDAIRAKYGSFRVEDCAAMPITRACSRGRPRPVSPRLRTALTDRFPACRAAGFARLGPRRAPLGQNLKACRMDCQVVSWFAVSSQQCGAIEQSSETEPYRGIYEASGTLACVPDGGHFFFLLTPAGHVGRRLYV